MNFASNGDFFVFVNNVLVVNLGGVHDLLQATLDFTKAWTEMSRTLLLKASI